jgi:hypothetical protein
VKVQIDRLWLRSFSEQSINDQEDDGADGGDENPAEVERFDLPETDEAAQKTADNRAGDANENRDKDPAWVFPGHDKLCESPGDEAQKNPGENAHAQFLGQIRRAGKDLFCAVYSGRRCQRQPEINRISYCELRFSSEFDGDAVRLEDFLRYS